MTKKFNFRRSDTGQYTTEEYAKNHPKTTEKEKVKSPSKPATPKKK